MKQKVEIIVSDADYNKACKLGKQTYKKFKNNTGHYRNLLMSHIRGKVGEIACFNWLSDNGIECSAFFEGMDKQSMMDCDISIGGNCIEVKTWSRYSWKSGWGRCVAVDQYNKIAKKANIIIWCITPNDSDLGGGAVEIFGWNYVAEVKDAPQRRTGPNQKKVFNYQVDEARVRGLDELINMLK